MKKITYLLASLLIPVSLYGQNSLSFSDTAVAHSEGIGLNVSIRSYPAWDYSGLMSNYIPRSGLEHNLDLSDVWKRVNCEWAPETTNPFQGLQAAKINAWGTEADPSIVRCQMSYNMYYRSDSQYELSFALKKDPGYAGG
jgi:hypothetical protein